jgi:hypothetical protein
MRFEFSYLLSTYLCVYVFFDILNLVMAPAPDDTYWEVVDRRNICNFILLLMGSYSVVNCNKFNALVFSVMDIYLISVK